MKGFIEFETCDHHRVLANVSQITSVFEGKGCNLICFAGGEDDLFKTDESYEEICKKIRDAVKE